MSLDGLVITDQRLGGGNFGTVFICQLGEKRVAAKKLSESKEEFDNLSREASKLRRLRFGKYITYTYETIMKEEDLYMIMEYNEHGDLQSHLKENKESVTYEQKILFCRGILLGLLYCHSMRIFHGDIKCENVLLGKNLEPKLTDFGLSVTVDNIAYYKNLYKGSLYWAAPELFSIKEDKAAYQEFIADPYPCDVYSLGATFCEISYDGTIEFIDSDDPAQDIILGIVSPIPKDGFLEEIVDGCCQFECNERISLDECLSALDNIAEEQFLVPAIDDKWQEIQLDIKTSLKLESPPLFILYRPSENLVIGPSNLSLLEWLCINDCIEAVEYMTQLHDPDKKQLEWLYNISVLCSSLDSAGFLRNILQDNTAGPLALSDLIDLNPWQLIEAFIKAGANCNEISLLDKAVIGHYNKVVQLYFENASSYRKTVIYDTIKYGNAEAARISANLIDLEFRDENGDTPLLAAIDAGNIEILKILLDHKVNVHNKNNLSQHISRIGGQHTPLIRAAVKGNQEIIELLISAGATIDTGGSEWHSLVQNLEKKGRSAIIQLISNAMRKRVNTAERNHSAVVPTSNSRDKVEKSAETTPLCTAIRNRQLDLVKKLIDDGSDANECDYDEYSPLHWAVIIGDKEIVGILLKAGADINTKTLNEKQNFYVPSSLNYFSGYTPLHIAIVKRHLRIAKLLIESGANFSLRNEAGQTIMDIANKDDKEEIERVIQECAPATEDSFQWVLKTMSPETVKTLISSMNASIDTLNHFLCIAVCQGNTEAINYLLEHRANVNSKYEDKSPLEWAIFGGHAQIVKILIDQGAEIHSKRSKKRSSKSVIKGLKNLFSGKKSKASEIQNLSDPLLHQAAALNNVEIVEILLKSGVDIDARNNTGYNALYYAALYECDEVVALLYDKGAKVRLWKKKEDSDTIYKTAKYIAHKAAKTGKVNIGKIFTDAGVVNFENKSNSALSHTVMLDKGEITAEPLLKNSALFSTSFDKITTLTEAVKNNQLKKVKLLLSSGADINAKNTYGRTLLIECVALSLVDMVQLLIEKGADVNAIDKDGNAPIHYVKNIEVAEFLISHDADINIKSTNGRTPLIECTNNSLVDIVQFLIEKGADVNAIDKDGNAPIHHAKDREVTQILIAHGADINARDIYGVTPLSVYVIKSLVDMVQLLAEKGVDANAKNEDNYAPIHFVRDREIAEILISHGADINARGINGVTPLFTCVYESLIDMVQFLIEKGADVNVKNEDGYASIHFVKNIEIAKILISHGADINARNTNGRTPLIECTNNSLVDMMQFLIEKGADVNAIDRNGNAPIHSVKDREIAKILISHGADVNTKSINGTTPLFECVKKSLTDIVQFLIEKGADVNAKNEDGYASIHFVKDIEIAKILISHGADINARNADGRTPLIECVDNSLIDMAQFLIEKGADVNAIDKNGNAPIHSVKDREVAKILIAHGADINARGIYGVTPLFVCVIKSLVDMVQLLAEKGVDVNAKNEDGFAPIHYVKDREVAEILISHGANINVKSTYGRTPLIEYTNNSLVDMVQLLAEKGADINAKNEDGYAPIHFAKDREIAEILISYGADVNAKDIDGITPLFKCVYESLIDMVQLLIENGADVSARDNDGYASIHHAKNRQIVDILITHGADINIKNNDGITLFSILLEEQNENLDSIVYRRREVSKLLEYLRSSE